MLKRFICSAFMVAALCGTGTTHAQADELYIRNRLFKDAYFSGGAAYVPVDGFLKAIRVPWSASGSTVTVGKGSSPALSSSGEMVTIVKGGESTQLSGITRNGKLYVNSKEIAKATGYGLIYNRATGVFDVVKSRFTSDSDEKAAEEVATAKETAKAERDAAWQQRVEKARAERKAKEEAEAAEEGEDEDSEGEDEDMEDSDEDSDGEDMASADEDEDSSDSEDEDEGDFDEEESASEDKSAEKEEEKEEEPPKKADLVVLSTDANPNFYTGDCVFQASIQNQGYAAATKVKASFTVIGPDGQTWVKKTIYHGDIGPDGRWTISEKYSHRLKSAMPRGDFDIRVTPSFESAAPK